MPAGARVLAAREGTAFLLVTAPGEVRLLEARSGRLSRIRAGDPAALHLDVRRGRLLRRSRDGRSAFLLAPGGRGEGQRVVRLPLAGGRPRTVLCLPLREGDRDGDRTEEFLDLAPSTRWAAVRRWERLRPRGGAERQVESLVARPLGRGEEWVLEAVEPSRGGPARPLLGPAIFGPGGALALRRDGAGLQVQRMALRWDAVPLAFPRDDRLVARGPDGRVGCVDPTSLRHERWPLDVPEGWVPVPPTP
ncbi:MAG: hypothetical protein HY722_16220 [Planctomycetes bacterium]|nr:hypothetical protein [Planctomycetota bacterium]